MIFVTVGMQLAFERLIAAMDALAPTLGMPVIAQTGWTAVPSPTARQLHAALAALIERRPLA